VRSAIEAAPAWVADGNYSAVRDILWSPADTIIWLDYPLWFTLWRLWRRTWQRVFSRAELWNGNRETLRGALFSRDSLFFYVLRTYRSRKRKFTTLFREKPYSQARYLRFGSQRELDAWLAEIGIR
jgi:adenylate kinase family enzyme